MSVEDRSNVPRSDADIGQIPISRPRRRIWDYWLPFVIFLIGAAVLIPRLLNLESLPTWLGPLSDVLGVVSVIVSSVMFAIRSRPDDGVRSADVAHPRPEFPFHTVSSIAQLAAILLPDPTGDIPLPDRGIPFVARDLHAMESAFSEKGQILVRGRSKTGKTRAVIELLRRYLRTSPTILVLKRNTDLSAPTYIPSELPKRNLVILIDDLHLQTVACQRQKTTVGDALSHILDRFHKHCGNQIGEVRFVAITRQETECWEPLHFHPAKKPWSLMALVDFPDLSTDDARRLTAELAGMPPALKIEPHLADQIARTNDGTFYRLVLAFRDWRSRPEKREVTEEDINELQTDLVSAWRHRRSVLFLHRPHLRQIYAALDLIRTLGLPTHPELVGILARFLKADLLTIIWTAQLRIEHICDEIAQRLLTSLRTSAVLIGTERIRKKLRLRQTQAIVGLMRFVANVGRARKDEIPVGRLPSRIAFWIADALSYAGYVLLIGLLVFGIVSIPFGGYLIGLLGLVGLTFITWLTLLTMIGVYPALLRHLIEGLWMRRMVRLVEYLGRTEIPISGEVLTPYDLQVEGCVRDISTPDWVKSLLEQRAVDKPDLVLAVAITRWLEKASRRTDAKNLPVMDLLLRLDPQHKFTYLRRGRIYQRLGRYDEALSDLGEAARLNPPVGWIVDERATLYRQLGRYDDALAEHNRAVKIDPQDTEIVAGRAITYRSLERYSEALADHNRAAELNPINASVLTQRALTYSYLGRYREALSDHNRAVELDPKDAWTIVQRAMTYRWFGRYAEALADHNRAVELDPKDAWAIVQRAMTYRWFGRYAEALADHNRAVGLDPKDGWIIAQRGLIYRELGRQEEALADHNRAVELDPTDAWIVTQRGITYREWGRLDEALADHNRAVELDSKDAWTISARGETYRRMERYDAALTDFDRAVEFDPAYSWPLFLRACVSMTQHEVGRAMADLRLAIGGAEQEQKLNPTSWVPTINLALYHLAMGDHLRADEIYHTLISKGATAYMMKEAHKDLKLLLEVQPDIPRGGEILDWLAQQMQSKTQ